MVTKLAENPADFLRFFELDQKAIAAQIGIEDTGEVRREAYAFQEAMKAKYGTKLTGDVCTIARLIHSAKALVMSQSEDLELTETVESEAALAHSV